MTNHQDNPEAAGALRDLMSVVPIRRSFLAFTCSPNGYNGIRHSVHVKEVEAANKRGDTMRPLSTGYGVWHLDGVPVYKVIGQTQDVIEWTDEQKMIHYLQHSEVSAAAKGE